MFWIFWFKHLVFTMYFHRNFVLSTDICENIISFGLRSSFFFCCFVVVLFLFLPCYPKLFASTSLFSVSFLLLAVPWHLSFCLVFLTFSNLASHFFGFDLHALFVGLSVFWVALFTFFDLLLFILLMLLSLPLLFSVFLSSHILLWPRVFPDHLPFSALPFTFLIIRIFFFTFLPLPLSFSASFLSLFQTPLFYFAFLIFSDSDSLFLYIICLTFSALALFCPFLTPLTLYTLLSHVHCLDLSFSFFCFLLLFVILAFPVSFYVYACGPL